VHRGPPCPPSSPPCSGNYYPIPSAFTDGYLAFSIGPAHSMKTRHSRTLGWWSSSGIQDCTAHAPAYVIRILSSWMCRVSTRSIFNFASAPMSMAACTLVFSYYGLGGFPPQSLVRTAHSRLTCLIPSTFLLYRGKPQHTISIILCYTSRTTQGC
jgi:hypothetical protein